MNWRNVFLSATLAACGLTPLLTPATAQPAAVSPCAARATGQPTHGFSDAVTRNAPSVVTVIVIRGRRGDGPGADDALYFQPMAAPAVPDATAAAHATTLERSFGSGFVVSGEGEILTSAHAVFDAQQVWVELADGRRFPARVAGFDRRDDVALLRVDVPRLAAVQVAPDEPVCAGDWVAALGSPFGFEHSVSAGVVSMYPRLLPGGHGVPLIQTDVAVNPGSSGGPLFNAEGKVIGMNLMIFSDTGIYVGLSFALPIARALRVASELRAAGSVRRPDFGLRTQPLNVELAQAFGLAQPQGSLVIAIKTGGPAHKAGVVSGDIILAIDGKPSLDGDVEGDAGAVRPGDVLALDVWRERAARRLKLRVVDSAAAPAHAAAPAALARETRLGLVLVTARGPSAPPGAYVDSAAGSSLLAGIEPGDRISAVNGIAVADPAAFDAALAGVGSNPVVALLVTRSGMSMYIPVRRIGY